MFRRLGAEALTLRLGENELHFGSPTEFEFALAGRTCVPSHKIAALVGLADDALLREAEAIRVVEQRFADALAGTLEDVTSISPFLGQVDLTLVSQDHCWRLIISALNANARPCEEYKKVALVKYMQYLAARQEVVKTLYSNRQLGRLQALDASGSANGRPRETLIFNLQPSGIEAQPSPAFSRIPKGETVEIEFAPRQEMELLIARHRCRLALSDGLHFIDERGRDRILHSGKSIVGRDASSDVVIDPSHRDVSRKHLIVETDGAHTVRLTDISSHGTSVPSEYLDSTSI